MLLAGAGGGFDVHAGLPLALALRAQGKEVHLANLTFSYLAGTDATWVAPHVARVDAKTQGEERYFPERTLARWLSSQGLPDVVYAFKRPRPSSQSRRASRRFGLASPIARGEPFRTD